MTLVVIFKDGDGLTAFADTRVSRSDISTSDYAPKLFVIPVKTTVHADSEAIEDRWDCAMAYAVFVMGASFIYATVSAICGNLFSENRDSTIGVGDIAALAEKVATKILHDAAARWPLEAEIIFNTRIAIFGWCPLQRRMVSYIVAAGYVQGDPVVTMGESKIDGSHLVVMGSGKTAFDRYARKNLEATGKVDVYKAFMNVMQDPDVKGVGGDVQLLRATADGIQLPPVVNRSDDPDKPTFKLYGFGVEEIGVVGHFKVGDHRPGRTVYGFGLEQAVDRRRKSRLGIDPDK